jgi:hypothetical protein
MQKNRFKNATSPGFPSEAASQESSQVGVVFDYAEDTTNFLSSSVSYPGFIFFKYFVPDIHIPFFFATSYPELP